MTDNELKKILQEKFIAHEMNVPANGFSSIEKGLPIAPFNIPAFWKWSVAIGVAAMFIIGVVLFNLPSNTVPSGENLAESKTSQPASVDNSVESSTHFSNEEIPLIAKTDKKEKSTKKTDKVEKKTSDKSTKKQKKAKGKKTNEDEDSNGSKEREKLETTPQDNQNQSPSWHEQDDDGSEYIVLNQIVAPGPTVNITSPKAQKPNILSIEEAEILMNEKYKKTVINKEVEIITLNSNPKNWSVGLLASLTPNIQDMSFANKTVLLDNSFSYRSLNRTSAKHDLPLMVGLSVGIPLVQRLSLQTGVNYAYIHSIISKSNLGTGERTEDNQKLHYLGIPVMLSYRIVNHKIVQFYASAGGMGEKGLIKDVSTRYFENYDILSGTDSKQESIKGVQWSLTANLGLGINLYQGLALYFEPGFTWYIPNTLSPQPNNSRTEHPYNLSLSAGLRYNLKK